MPFQIHLLWLWDEIQVQKQGMSAEPQNRAIHRAFFRSGSPWIRIIVDLWIRIHGAKAKKEEKFPF
jgi:hypothetical protein